MSTGVVMMEQEASGTGAWTSRAPSFEDLRKTCVDIPTGSDCLLLHKWNSCHMADFAKKTAIICLLVLRARLNLEGGAWPWNSQTDDCCFVSGSY